MNPTAIISTGKRNLPIPKASDKILLKYTPKVPAPLNKLNTAKIASAIKKIAAIDRFVSPETPHFFRGLYQLPLPFPFPFFSLSFFFRRPILFQV
jgi:hypothetical protein